MKFTIEELYYLNYALYCLKVHERNKDIHDTVKDKILKMLEELENG